MLIYPKPFESIVWPYEYHILKIVYFMSMSIKKASHYHTSIIHKISKYLYSLHASLRLPFSLRVFSFEFGMHSHSLLICRFQIKISDINHSFGISFYGTEFFFLSSYFLLLIFFSFHFNKTINFSFANVK